MYRLGHHRQHRVWLLLCAAAGVVALTAFGLYRLSRSLRADTSLIQSSPVTHHVAASTSAMQQITERYFTLRLPSGWQSVAAPPVPYTVYSWQGTGGDSARRLDMYIDNTPADLAVNRLLAVQADSDHMDIADAVSDNCTDFTDRATGSSATGTAPAKWAGVNFICDMGNYERDVVATGSPDAVNAVTLTGSTTGSHKVLLVYTDNSADPDYTIFDAMVRSFRVL